MTMAKCPICSQKLLRHAKQLSCSLCLDVYHMKCISIDPIVIADLENDNNWFCVTCIHGIFPFNNLESQEEFISLTTGSCSTTISSLSDKLFLPFELNDIEHKYITYNEEIDPDLQFYHSYNQLANKSDYLTESTFCDTLFNSRSKKQVFSICHLNIRSIRKNLSAFENYTKLLQYEFPIIGFSETWLTDHDCNLHNILGYEMIEKHRSSKSGGGVAICLKTGVEYAVRNDLGVFNDFLESVFIEIDKSQFGTSRDLVIGTLYRTPDSDIRPFIDSITLILDKINNENKLLYLLGDSNINLLNSESHALTNEFIDVMYSFQCFPLISRPTRITPRSATLIDNIFTNNIDDLNASINGILVTDISDHFPIFHINYAYTTDEIESYFITRIYSEKNKQLFQETISALDWNNLHNEVDPQSCFNLLHDRLITIHDKCFPKMKIKKKYSNRKPWLSESLRSSIKIKNKLYHISKRIPCVRNITKYHSYKNTLSRLLKKAEKNHYRDILMANRNNMRKSWTIIKNVIGKYKKAAIQKTFKLSDGTTTKNKKVISETFNEFFINVGPNLSKAIPHIEKSHLYCMGEKIRESIFLEPVTYEETNDLLNSLKNSACGWDNLSVKFIKLCKEFIVAPLTHILNLSLLEGVFPEQLKIANVIPLHKSDDPMLFNHYRPVSLLCILSKVFEKIMYVRLLKFLEKLKCIYKNQFGFRKHHSTYMALMLLMDKITQSMDNGEFVVGVFLDFSKAFDTVNHSILLSKMEHYGIRGNALNWFKSYLSKRYQFVTYDEEKSSTKEVICGVPQGSILGPLLFLIYINDLSNICEFMMPLLFADDTNLFNSGKDSDKVQREVLSDLEKISEWLKVNKLSLNIKKTHFMVFTTKNSPIPKINIKIDGHPIDEVLKTKFLGVIIDNQLTWKHHIHYICGKIAKGIGIVIKARKLLDQQTLLSLYYSFVYPYLQYCNHVWGKTYDIHLKKLFILQKRIVRIIAGVKPREHTEKLFIKFDMLTIFQINHYLIAKFMYQVYHKKTLGVFITMFNVNSNVHRYNTRQVNHFHLEKPKKELRKSSIKYRGAIIWNNILSLKFSTDVKEATFSKHLRVFIINGNCKV